MRIDVVSIFPDYLAPLQLSLAGKARDKGLLDLHVHDLRDWAHDRHRTVDDTPYGGGAGMVMKPEPWGEAFDAVLPDSATPVVPTPSGTPFTQALARDLATRDHLVFACGRYEGIDQRVIDEARTRVEVLEVSIGDYVLNGGEVAALAITEAVVRLVPGFMGNPGSLLEESHTLSDSGASLLEYPVYTKPASWRGHEVPPVLLSGDHARIAAWRHEQAVRRTAERRPDLAHPAAAVQVGDLDGQVTLLRRSDLGELQTLQWACFDPEDRESVEQLAEDAASGTAWVLRVAGRLVGSVAARRDGEGDTWYLFMLMVAPDLRGRGLGSFLLRHAEEAAPAGVSSYALVTRATNATSQKLYKRLGYRSRGEVRAGVVRMTRRR